MRTRAVLACAVIGALAAMLGAVGAPRDAAGARSWLILVDQTASAARVARAVAERGGRVTHVEERIHLVVAASERPGFARDIADLDDVVGVGPDRRGARMDGADAMFGIAGIGPEVDASEAGDGNTGDDPLSYMQWNLDAIDAPQAWDEGARGAGALVAVLDTGINPDHPDLAGSVRMDLSASFVPGQDVNVMPLPPPPRDFAIAHGTLVAGVIAARRNGHGMIGVAPECEILPVKVLSHFDGYGTWGMVIAGILHAADHGADVINMSLGGTLNRRGGWDDNGTRDPADDIWLTPSEVAAVVNALQRAVDYAHGKGALVVAAAGNAANDGDHDADQVVLPAGLAKVISVSATSPIGWWLDRDTDLDVLAPYSNFGQSAIDLAAPGGAFRPVPYRGYDGILAPVPAGPYYFVSGTSLSAPHVSGVAALVVGRNGGAMNPTQLETVLRKSAEDLGKPGRDDDFGHGRVNALEAVK